MDLKFIINLTGRLTKAKVTTQYENWLKAKASQYLIARTRRLSDKTDTKPSRIIIKGLKDKWGSASKEGVIRLNYNLMKCSRDIIDYIIIHELCHLKIQDHSHRYWNLVRKHCPDYKNRVKELENMSRVIG